MHEKVVHFDRSEYLKRIYLCSIGSTLFIAILHIWFAPLPNTIFFFLLFIFFVTGYTMLKVWGKYQFSMMWYIHVYWASFTLYSIYTGGIWAPSIFLLIFLPIIFIGFKSVKISLIILVIVCLTFVFIYLFQNYITFSTPQNRSFWILATLLAAAAVVYLFVYSYHKIAITQNEELVNYNIKLALNEKQLSVQNKLINEQIQLISEDKEKLEEKNNRLEQFTDSFIEISKMEELLDGDYNYSIKVLLKTIKQDLKADNVSIWKYDELDEKLVLIQQIKNSTKSSSLSFNTLYQKDFPIYFEHICAGMILRANDVFIDESTQELVAEYFSNSHVESMMDCPLFLDGKFVGVICCEVFKQRKWKTEDAIYIKGMSHLAGVSLRALHKMNHIKNLELENQMREAESSDLKKKVEKGNKMLSSVSDEIIDYANVNAHKVRGPVCRLIGLLELMKHANSQEDLFKIKGYLGENIHALNEATLEFGEVISGIDEKLNTCSKRI